MVNKNMRVTMFQEEKPEVKIFFFVFNVILPDLKACVLWVSQIYFLSSGL